MNPEHDRIERLKMKATHKADQAEAEAEARELEKARVDYIYANAKASYQEFGKQLAIAIETTNRELPVAKRYTMSATGPGILVQLGRENAGINYSQFLVNFGPIELTITFSQRASNYAMFGFSEIASKPTRGRDELTFQPWTDPDMTEVRWQRGSSVYAVPELVDLVLDKLMDRQ